MGLWNYGTEGLSMTILHYIFDPLCGWCYGAAPLIAAARGIPGLHIALHAGGMMTGANRHAVTPHLRNFVMSHDRRIALMTGQPFGDAYFDGLLRDDGAILDSTAPSAAIIAAEKLAGRGLDMLRLVQHAHYVDGRRVADAALLGELARQLQLAPQAFAESYARLESGAIEQHFTDSRGWLARSGGQGFPTIVLEQAEQTLVRPDPGAWLGRTAQWSTYLCELVSGPAGSVQAASVQAASVRAASVRSDPAQAGIGPVCGVDACEI